MKILPLLRLLTLNIGFTILLIAFRIFYSESMMYIFFTWNLFLAAVPLFISITIKHVQHKFLQGVLFFCWLLFFPNALYIITDLVHLKERYPIPLWFDVVLVFSAAINGLLLAYYSLKIIESFLTAKFTARKTAFILFCSIFLSSFGVYLGRFLRWNSWDVVNHPRSLLLEILQRFTNPFEHPRTWGMTIILTLFFSIFYFSIKKFSIINHETNLV